jgi:predicted nucleotidyltransferase
MGPVQELALDLSADERTLRRAIADGALHAWRPGPRRLRLAPGEREYLRAHWQLLSELRGALRTERGVRLAVLYGSLARGDEDADSDLDLLIALAGDSIAAGLDLSTRLRGATGRQVDVAHLGRVEQGAPLLLDRVLDEGRVLVDREGQWRQLRARRRTIRARAQRSHRRQMAAASLAIAELTGE